VLTVRRLQDDGLTVRPDTGGVETFDPGVVGAVEVQPIDGAQGLLTHVHFLEEPCVLLSPRAFEKSLLANAAGYTLTLEVPSLPRIVQPGTLEPILVTLGDPRPCQASHRLAGPLPGRQRGVQGLGMEW
jgi:hypothetical protein